MLEIDRYNTSGGIFGRLLVNSSCSEGHACQLQSLLADKFSFNLSKVHDKYWDQRYRLFSKFDSGIQLDAESWFSVSASCK